MPREVSERTLATESAVVVTGDHIMANLKIERAELMLLRVEQVADIIGVSKRTVWRLVSGGQLPQPVSIGRCRRWKHADVEQFVKELK